MWLYIGSLVVNTVVQQYFIKWDYERWTYTGEFVTKDDQILATLYLYIPAFLTTLIAILHTMIAV